MSDFKPVLGLDLGLKTLGIAVSRSGHLVTGLVNLHFPKNAFDEAYPKVLECVEEENIGTIVLGRPCYPSGDPAPMTTVVESFAKQLRIELDKKNHKDISIEFQDEQDSTLDASANLRELNLKAKKQKDIIDKAASKVILERWLRNKGYDLW